MNIKTSLLLAALAPALMAVVVGVAIFFAHRTTQTTQEQAKAIESVIHSVNELNSLVASYMLYHEERPRQQYLAEYDQLAQRLSSAQLRNAEHRQLLDTIRENAESMRTSFLGLVANYETTQRSPNDATLRRAGERVAGQLQVKARQTVADSVRLERLVSDEIASAQTTVNFLVLVVIVVVTVPITVVLLVTMRRVAASLAALRQGTEAVGAGNLAHRIALSGTDELAALAHSFDGMTERLQSVTVSKNELEEEVRERRRAEEALREAHSELETRVGQRTAELNRAMQTVEAEQQRFQEVLDQLPAYVILLSPDYHVPFANRFFEDRFGKSNGKRCFEYLFHRSEPCEDCQTYTVLKTNMPHRWEWTGPDARNYDIYDFPFTDVDGSPLIMEVGLDITERKRAEEELRRTTQILRAVSQNSPDLLFAKDCQCRLIYASESTLRLLGKSAEEVLGRTDAEFHPDPRLGEAVMENDRIVRETLQPLVVEEPTRLPDGSLRVFLSKKLPWIADDGTLLGTLGIAVDITERKEAEAAIQEANERLEQRVAQRTAALAESEEHLRLAVTATNLGTWDYNPITGALHWDARCKELFGIPPDEEVNYDTFLASLHPDDREHTHQVVQDAFGPASGGEFDIEYRTVGLRDGGTVRWVRATGRAFFNEDGQAFRFTGTVQDITDRKRADEALRASLAEKEVLLKEIHHRVKNNMQVISSLLALQADRSQDVAMCSVLQDVSHRVRSMALVHEKLYQSPDMARVEFAEYAQSLLNYLWRAYGTVASGVRLGTDLEPVLLSVNAAVPCGLILNELVSNALKHAFRGRASGQVTVSLRGGPEGCVCLRVRDNGTGLPTGLNWRQADSLGLRLVQILAGQLRATVEVSSGEGTEFTVTIGKQKT